MYYYYRHYYYYYNWLLLLIIIIFRLQLNEKPLKMLWLGGSQNHLQKKCLPHRGEYGAHSAIRSPNHHTRQSHNPRQSHNTRNSHGIRQGHNTDHSHNTCENQVFLFLKVNITFVTIGPLTIFLVYLTINNQ